MEYGYSTARKTILDPRPHRSSLWCARNGPTIVWRSGESPPIRTVNISAFAEYDVHKVIGSSPGTIVLRIDSAGDSRSEEDWHFLASGELIITRFAPGTSLTQRLVLE